MVAHQRKRTGKTEDDWKPSIKKASAEKQIVIHSFPGNIQV